MKTSAWATLRPTRAAAALLVCVATISCGSGFSNLKGRVNSSESCKTASDCAALKAEAEGYVQKCFSDPAAAHPLKWSATPSRDPREVCEEELAVFEKAQAAYARVNQTSASASITQPSPSNSPIAPGGPSSPIDRAKAWWTGCITGRDARQRNGNGEPIACWYDEKCFETCNRRGHGALDNAILDGLNIEQCRISNSRPDFQAACGPIINFERGGVKTFWTWPSDTYVYKTIGDWWAGKDGVHAAEYGANGITWTSFPPEEYFDDDFESDPRLANVRAKKYQARLAVMTSACRLLIEGSRSCTDLLAVQTNGGWDTRYRLSPAELASVTDTLNRINPAYDEAMWSELNAAGKLAACKNPQESKACAPVEQYLRVFPQGHHAAEASTLLTSTKARRDQLANKEAEYGTKYYEEQARQKATLCNQCVAACMGTGVAESTCRFTRCAACR